MQDIELIPGAYYRYVPYPDFPNSKVNWSIEDDDDPRCWSLYPTNRDLASVIVQMLHPVKDLKDDSRKMHRFVVYGTDIEFTFDAPEHMTPLSALECLALEAE